MTFIASLLIAISPSQGLVCQSIGSCVMSHFDCLSEGQAQWICDAQIEPCKQDWDTSTGYVEIAE